MEARNLLVDFRFDDDETRQRIQRWFRGREWRADHKRCEAFLNHLSGGETELARRWGMFSTLSHPTVAACRNSTAMTVSWVTHRPEDSVAAMEAKVADYLTSVVTLIIATTFDFSGWISLQCELGRMPHDEPFRARVKEIVAPILGRSEQGTPR